jgi:nitroreductase
MSSSASTLTRPVPLEPLRECLQIALQAPSASNAQPWHRVVVTDAAQRAAVGEISRQQVVRYAGSRGFAGRLFADRPDRAQVQHRVGARRAPSTPSCRISAAVATTAHSTLRRPQDSPPPSPDSPRAIGAAAAENSLGLPIS